MKKFLLLLQVASLTSQGFAQQQLATTCISNTTDYYGIATSGTFFTDFGYLYANELTYLVYRLSEI